MSLVASVGVGLAARPPGVEGDVGAPLGKGWGRVIAWGTLTRLGHPPTVLAILISGGRVDTFAGGTEWRQRAVVGPHLVRLLAQTLLVDSTERPVPLDAIRPGDPLTLWGVVRPDGEVFALTVVVQRSHSPPLPVPGVPGVAGVVVRRSGSTLELLTDRASRRTAIVTPATVVARDGRPVPAGSLAPYDILRVVGSVNSDGSIVATRITVEFATSSAAQVSGPVQEHLSGIGGLVVSGTMVTTSAHTYILRSTTPASFADIAPGQPVTAYGVPVMAGGTPVGIAARVVVAR